MAFYALQTDLIGDTRNTRIGFDRPYAGLGNDITMHIVALTIAE